MGNEKGISIQKLYRKYLFDQHIKSGDGELVGVEIETTQTDITPICMEMYACSVGTSKCRNYEYDCKKMKSK